MAAFEPLLLQALPAGVWRVPVPVRFGNCDPAGIVYTPEYFNLFNGVIEDWYGACLRLDYHELIGKRQVGLGYAHASADFARPGRMGDTLHAAVMVAAIGRSSITLKVHGFLDGRESVRATFVTVTTSLATHGPIPLPGDLRLAFEAYAAASDASAAVE